MRQKFYFLLILIAVAFKCDLIFAETFTAEPLPKVLQTRWIKDGIWSPHCPVPINRLKLLTLTYYDFYGKQQLGTLVTFDTIAPFVLDAFKEMYAIRYPLETVGFKGGETNEYQETSAYNCRSIRGESTYSMHAYGLAIDINVTRNPYLGEFTIDSNRNVSGQLIPPTPASYTYLNRAIQRPGMNEQIVKLMAQYGFIRWGGEWQDRVDYQHFEVPENITKQLIYLDEKSGRQFLQLVIRYPESAKKMTADSKWKYLYQLYPKQYLTVLAEYFPKLSSMPERDVFGLVYQKLSSS